MLIRLEAYYIVRKPLANREMSQAYWLLGFMGERRWQHFSLSANVENLLNIRHDRYQAVVLPPVAQPSFCEVWAPLDGLVANGAAGQRLAAPSAWPAPAPAQPA